MRNMLNRIDIPIIFLASSHPDHIVLETAGLANPYNLLDEISEVKPQHNPVG